MMIKFLAHGTGSAAKAADYLTRERFPAQDQEQDQDQEKNPEEVKVLRGNPDQVAAVADSLEFERKYTSGVIAWSPEDAPSDAKIDRVVDEFEKTALGGAGTGPLRLGGYRAPRSGQWGPVCSPSLAAATVYVELRGTMRNTKTRDRTRDVPSQEGHLDWSRPALIISHVFAILFSRQGGAKWC